MLCQELGDFIEFLAYPTPRAHQTGFFNRGTAYCIAVWLLLLSFIDFWVGMSIGLLEAYGILVPTPRDWESVAHNPVQRLLEDPVNFSLAPALDELCFRLCLVNPAGALWLLPWLLPIACSSSGSLFFSSGLTAMSLCILVGSMHIGPGRLWRRFWAMHCEPVFQMQFRYVLLASTCMYVVVECSRSGADILLALCTWQKGYVLAWVCTTRGMIAAVVLNSAASLWSDTLAWLYKDIFGETFHMIMLCLSVLCWCWILIATITPDPLALFKRFVSIICL